MTALVPELMWEEDIVDPKSSLVSEITLGFLAQYKKSTREAYRIDLKLFKRWLDAYGVSMMDVKRTHVELWLQHEKERGLALNTIGRRISTVCCWYRYAFEEEYLETNPAARVKRVKLVPTQLRDYLDHYDVAELLRTAKAESRCAFALMALMSLNGLRVGEAVSLNVSSYGRSGGLEAVRFMGKGDVPATVPLAPVAALAVRAHCKGRSPEKAMFLNHARDRMTRRNAHDLLKKLMADSRIPPGKHITPHTLRRSFVTNGLNLGVSLRDMQYSARHASSATTMRYDRSKARLQRDATFVVSQHVAAAMYS